MTLECFAKHFLKLYGVIFLPNVSCVNEMIAKYLDLLNNLYEIEFVAIAEIATNPLFRASGLGNVRAQLLKAPDKLINENQVLNLNETHPFIRLNLKDDLKRSQLLIRVFAGTKEHHNHQLVAFQSVWEDLFQPVLNVKIEFLYHDNVRDLNWGYKDIIEWLKGSNIHFILCHMHQGIKKGNNFT